AAGATVGLSHYFIGIQRPGINAVTVVGTNIVNAVVSYGLVFGLWGLPEMGFDGAAVGTVISTLLRLVWLLAALCLGRTAATFDARHTWRPDTDKIRRLVQVGWPAGIQFVLDIGAWAAFLVWIIGRFGTVHLAATATCWRFVELSFMPAVGIGLAVSSLVGQSVGEGLPAM